MSGAAPAQERIPDDNRTHSAGHRRKSRHRPAIAERFVAQGYKVAVTVRSGEGPEGTLTVRADVTDAAALDAAFTEVERALGPVEVVVANAGITKDTLLLRMSEDDFDVSSRPIWAERSVSSSAPRKGCCALAGGGSS